MAMLFTDSASIRDVIFFPTMKPIDRIGPARDDRAGFIQLALRCRRARSISMDELLKGKLACTHESALERGVQA